MFAIMASVLNVGLAWFGRVVLMKALFFGVLLAITTAASTFLMGKLDATAVGSLGSSLGSLSAGTLWLCAILRLDVGIPLVLTAQFTAFAIRRLPIIG